MNFYNLSWESISHDKYYLLTQTKIGHEKENISFFVFCFMRLLPECTAGGDRLS